MYMLTEYVPCQDTAEDPISIFSYTSDTEREIRMKIATTTTFATVTQFSAINFVMELLHGFHAFAGQIDARQARHCCQMMAYMTALYTLKATVHIVPTYESAQEQAGAMSRDWPGTAIAVPTKISDDHLEEIVQSIKNPNKFIVSIFITHEHVCNKVLRQILTALQSRRKLARIAIDEVEYLTTANEGLYNNLLLILDDYVHIPVMSWSSDVGSDQIEEVLIAVRMENHMTYYRQTAFDPEARRVYPSCNKIRQEVRLGEVRDITKWTIKIVETVESSPSLPLSLDMMIACVLGYTGERWKIEHKNLPHYCSMNGFEPFTIKKMCRELVNIGILKWQVNPAKGEKVTDHLELIINSSASAAVSAFKQGRIRLMIPIQYIFIFMQQKDKLTREKSDTKDGLCKEINVAQHFAMECSCQKVQKNSQGKAVQSGRSSDASSSSGSNGSKRQKTSP